MEKLKEPLVKRKDTKLKSINLKLDSLSSIQIIGYGVGHFQNDLCAACWFNYMLYFMKNVVFADSEESSFYAGIVLLSGQIADGLATPLVGFLSDKINTRFGRRTPWYFCGSIIVTVCFLFIFQECLLCEWFGESSPALLTFYYIFFPSLFNVGWAAVQVSHMSLVPSLTISRSQRDKLNSLRNTFTYIANLYVLIVAFIVFLTMRVLSFASVGLGALTSFFFICTLGEKKLAEDCNKIKTNLENTSFVDQNSEIYKNFNKCFEESGMMQKSENQSKIHDKNDKILNPSVVLESSGIYSSIICFYIFLNATGVLEKKVFTSKQWFKLPSFYIYGFVYMGSRVLVNVQSSLIIFYLQNVLGIARGVNTYINGVPIDFAIIPMIIYLSSTITSSCLKNVYKRFGRKKIYVLGTITSVLSTIAMMILNESSTNWMFGLSVPIGLSQSICLNTGIALISEVVGARGSNAAFVFGCYSFLDKIMSGIILYLIMNINDVTDHSNSLYTRICASVVPTVGACVACIFVLIGKANDYDSGDIVTEGSCIINQNKESSLQINV